MKPDVIEHENEFYIRAESSLADTRTLVLLHNDTFAVFDRYGDILPVGLGQQGIFHQGTRYVSKFEIDLSGHKPLLLSSMTSEDNVMVTVDLTNPDMELTSGELKRGMLHIRRSKFLADHTCFDRIAVQNFGSEQVEVDLSFTIAADFKDIFEVRGKKRDRRGNDLPLQTEENGLVLAYVGLDQVTRKTMIRCCAASVRIRNERITVPVRLGPGEETEFALDVVCEESDEKANPVRFKEALHTVKTKREASPIAQVGIYTSNEQFNDWLNRSRSDLEMMLGYTEFGPYPYAGVPWFSTVFGRDGIITALELLWLAPEVAKGVLSYLAATQATSLDPEKEAEPGKILHEARKGEMANLGEVPFGRYYGSVDSTPLFVLLAACYYERTVDSEFLRGIWPNILAALDWIDRYGDADGDGFVEYSQKNKAGLLQQGWKDSQDSVFHKDGTLARAPIALCEVQGYVYVAKVKIAKTAEDLGHAELAKQLRSQAQSLSQRFSAAFWSDDLGMFAMALDGNKRRCEVRSSNAGQCLFSGIAPKSQAGKTAKALISPDMFSGWGVRTIGTGEKRYNPMSYHDGSVWPHDNAMIAFGDRKSRDKNLTLGILSGLLDLSLFVDLHRLPELICGFPRRHGKGPTLYPVACSPQAWAAGAVFMVLQSCLGLSIHAGESQVCVCQSALPEAVSRVEIRNLRVGEAKVDLAFERYGETVAVNVLRRSGELEIIARK
jgi:glycogen debranching enzyme